MSIRTIEGDFEYQAKHILIKVLKGQDNLKLYDVDELNDQLWVDYAKEIGREFLQALTEWDGDETLLEVMEELTKKK